MAEDFSDILQEVKRQRGDKEASQQKEREYTQEEKTALAIARWCADNN